ncbi:type IX secretion system membrane protein PorP/SprF [Aureivirga sp. CE67]|uniref:PorP/SprF family type IX secretion system membrane protein n=1 Tax=Aureivirga sp. CE67 TaxID=1788983 RepID=UPI001E533480|nr:type IX secretion system membrane protein PorP/SprF [Aureivirga sp. CE67]
MKTIFNTFKKPSFYKLLGCVIIALITNIESGFAQQEPQYTQYMYNTMAINPAYAGQRDVLSISGLYRSQWVGISGAPETQSFGIHSPLRNKKMGLGLTVVNDKIGPASEIYVNANFSYTLLLNENDLKLSFGVKGGFNHLNMDWNKGKIKNQDQSFRENISQYSPTIGAGFYLHNKKWYVGLSVPSFLTTKQFRENEYAVGKERLHYYLIGGYVFDLSENLKFKPSTFLKAVAGAPLTVDLSANFLLYEKFTAGLAYRWDDSVSGLVGFQATEDLFIGYAYDYTTTDLQDYNNGSHEIMLRFEFRKDSPYLSPRFF